MIIENHRKPHHVGEETPLTIDLSPINHSEIGVMFTNLANELGHHLAGSELQPPTPCSTKVAARCDAAAITCIEAASSGYVLQNCWKHQHVF